jgi:type II secretory pathway pseudopilin PulG
MIANSDKCKKGGSIFWKFLYFEVFKINLMTTKNRIIALIFLTLIGNFFTLNAQMLVKKDKAKKNQNSIALQKDNKGLGQKLPTKENVTALLTDFDWDAKTTTNREEAFRILDAMGGEFLHVVPVGNRSFIACSELPSGYFVCIGVNQKDPYRGRYSLRYGSMEDYSNIFRNRNGRITLSNKFLELNSYVFQKQTDLNREASFLGVAEKDYRIDNSAPGIFFAGSYALKYLAENPAVFMTNRGRASTILNLIREFFDYDELYAPLILNDYSQDDSIRGGDVIFGIVDKGKIDRINLNNYKRKLHKGKSLLKVILFRKGRFLVRNWDPTLRDYNYRTSTGYKSDRWWLREQLIFYVLNSGSQEPSDSFWDDFYAQNILPSIITLGYSKQILNMFIEYGADIHSRYDITPNLYWYRVDDKIKIGYSLLHRAAKAHEHVKCTYYSHHVYKNRYQEDQEIYENAYFDLIALGLKDDQPLEKPHKTLGYSTPKEFYDLANNPDHIFRPKEKTQVDWGAIANAVVAGASAAVQEKQRQIQETQQIKSINQAYQARIDAGIEAQRQQVAQSNAEYLKRINNTSQTVYNTTSTSKSQNQVQTSKKDDVPGYNYTNNVNLNAGNAPNGHSQDNNAIVLSAQQPIEEIKQLDNSFTWYNVGGTGEPADSPYLRPIGETSVYANTSSTVVGYRNSYRPKVKEGGNGRIPGDWYIETLKHEVWENTTKNTDIEFKKKQVQIDKRQFFTMSEALNAPIDNAQGVIQFWSEVAAQNWINERLNVEDKIQQ